MVRYSTPKEITTALFRDKGRKAIIWLRIAEPDSKALDELRAKYYIKNNPRPTVKRHLSLFTQFPSSGCSFYEDVLARYASSLEPFKLGFITHPFIQISTFKKAVGLDIESPALFNLHSDLSREFEYVKLLKEQPKYPKKDRFRPKFMLQAGLSMEEAEDMHRRVIKDHPGGFGQFTVDGFCLTTKIGRGEIETEKDFLFRGVSKDETP